MDGWKEDDLIGWVGARMDRLLVSHPVISLNILHELCAIIVCYELCATSVVNVCRRKMASIEREVLKQLTPLLSRNLDLGDYDVTEQLHADDIITPSDEERYVEPYKRNRAYQVLAWVYVKKLVLDYRI